MSKTISFTNNTEGVVGGSSRKRSKAKQHGMEESERQLAARAIYIHGRGWLQMVSHVARVECRWLAAGHESNPGTSRDLGPDHRTRCGVCACPASIQRFPLY
jgi:hypothetical protein